MNLSPRERMELARLVAGEARETIARDTCPTLRTVERTITGLRAKLRTSNLAALGFAVAALGIQPPCDVHTSVPQQTRAGMPYSPG